MHLKQNGATGSLLYRQVEVQKASFARGGIGNVTHVAHTRAPKAEGPQPVAAVYMLLQLDAAGSGQRRQIVAPKRHPERSIESRARIKPVLQSDPQ